MTKIKAESLITYAKNAVGGGYCWGADGQTCTPAFRQELAARTSNSAAKENLLTVCAKWDGRKVWDCSGLFRGAWRMLLKYRSGGATGIYRDWCTAKGTIDTMPDVPGIAVFRGTLGNMEHVGLYIGNGEVIDARSSKRGVLRGTIESYGRWTHWGRLDDVDYDAQTGTDDIDTVPAVWSGTVKTRTGGGISLWDTPLKTVPVLRVPEGETVDVLEDRRSGFVLARYGGHIGYADTQYLMEQGGSTRDSGANTDRFVALEERVTALEKIVGTAECESCMIGGEENG